jgi:hypothetical protein
LLKLKNIKFSKKQIESLPFTSKEYFVSSHETRYNKVDFKKIFNAILRIFFSIFGKLFVKTSDEKILIYHGGYKTRTELDLFKSLLNDDCICFTDRGLANDSYAYFVRSSSLTYIFDTSFLAELSLIFSSPHYSFILKFFLFSDLVWNYGYYHHLNKKYKKLNKVISFFSTTTSAFILYRFSNKINAKFIYYTWGSNLASYEFKFGRSDITLVKNKNDLDIFSQDYYGDVFHVGDASFDLVVNSKYSINKSFFKVLIIDSCCSDNLSFDEKTLVYRKIEEYFSELNCDLFIRPHPAVGIDELQFLLANLNFDSEVCILPKLSATLTESLNEFDLYVNINSTLKDELVFKGVPVVDFGSYISQSLRGEVVNSLFSQNFPGWTYVLDDKCYEGDILYDPNKIKGYVEMCGIKAIDKKLIIRILND